MRDATARQLDAFIDPPPRKPAVIRTPDLRIAAPSSPGSESSRRAAETVAPFRRKTWNRILVALYKLPPGAMLSQEEIAQRVEMKDGPCCARLSELKTHWVEMIPDALMSKAGVPVNGHRLTAAGRGLFEERR